MAWPIKWLKKISPFLRETSGLANPLDARQWLTNEK
jgi:hypothetical protein